MKIEVDDKKDIKKQRIKMYFLEAAKDLIIAQGVENVSVRKVASMAGYSYATIYNYFEDLNELLWHVRSFFIRDIGEYIGKRVNEPLYDKEGIKRLFRAYIAYYFENPNVFRFFYFHQLRKPEQETEGMEGDPDFEEIWKETFKSFVLNGTLQAQDIEAVSKIFIYAMHGMIALSFSNNGDLTEENVYRDLEKIVDYIL
ncbi:MAG TPA: TetR/AcrR family transcriptional regulator [Patescibacteria group bacterium]|nr:TetR/AcrR family transcriptional regulator [Patescibacteria group bacterium]